MPDIIQILPDAIANQIAAGEVIQRPASAVKELMENAVDAGARKITVIVKEGGKSFIQVTDDGIGMSETDARLCFERHATSKIRKADDLFAIRTKGFRGEALASIAAVAKVNLKTRRPEDSLGTQIEIEASELIFQEPCNIPSGSVFTVKNLFYNVPARRKFLKSDAVEMRHILEEFQRIALAHPEIEFYLYNNQSPVYQLEPGTFRQRIVQILGSNYNDRLVPVTEETDFVRISGFIVKPEFARKTRGEQFFFVNDRFIKNSYLHHAVVTAFSDLIASESHPGYFIKLEVNPSQLDVNIHPTKTEVKFEDERFIYAILRSSIRRALGKYNIAPSLDFDNEPAFDIPLKKNIHQVKPPQITVNPGYNPFAERPSGGFRKMEGLMPALETKPAFASQEILIQKESPQIQTSTGFEEDTLQLRYFQWMNKYLVVGTDQGLFIIDQHRAHERVLYDRMAEAMEKNKVPSQMELFPETLQLSATDASLMDEMLEDLQCMGFDIEPFGTNTYLIRGIPGDAIGHQPLTLIEGLLEDFRTQQKLNRTERRQRMLIVLSNKMAIKSGVILNRMEAEQLVTDLFHSTMPYTSPSGKPILFRMNMEELDEKFLKNRS
jgi:DNA mismatch repair protein MutL